MDFETCYKLLAARPAHAHTECEGEQHAHDHEVENVTNAVASDLTLSEHESAAPVAENQELQSLSVAELGRAFFALQERRVQIYREFQDGFNAHKATPKFQSFCAGITQEFADVSKRVNAIESTLRSKERVALAQLLRRVQEQEKEKLLLTSALLVEKMRLADMRQRVDADESRMALLETSIKTMRATHTGILEHINELLDELRMELVDEQE